jgi:hypothetical protein
MSVASTSTSISIHEREGTPLGIPPVACATQNNAWERSDSHPNSVTRRLDESQSPHQAGMSTSKRPSRTLSNMGVAGHDMPTHQKAHVASNLADNANIPTPISQVTSHLIADTLADMNCGLSAPMLSSGVPVTGANTDMWRQENKTRRKCLQAIQPEVPSYWSTHVGQNPLPPRVAAH